MQPVAAEIRQCVWRADHAQARQIFARARQDFGDAIDPVVCLEALRAEMAAGHYEKATVIATLPSLAAAKEPEVAVFRDLELALLGVMRDADMQAALPGGASAYCQALRTLAPVEQAKAARRLARLTGVARTFQLQPPSWITAATRRLSRAIKTLGQGGEMREHVEGQLLLAHLQPPLSADKANWIADLARQQGLHDLAGSALLKRIQASGDAVVDPQLVGAAREAYALANHAGGPLMLDLAAARQSGRNGAIDLEALDRIRQRALEAGQLLIEVETLQAMISEFHSRGEHPQALPLHARLEELIAVHRLGLLAVTHAHGMADIWMRRGQYGEILTICRRAISQGVPKVIEAGFHLMMANSYSFITDLDKAITEAGEAVALCRTLVDAPIEAAAIGQLAAFLSSRGRGDDLSKAESLLTDAISKPNFNHKSADGIGIQLGLWNIRQRSFASLDAPARAAFLADAKRSFRQLLDHAAGLPAHQQPRQKINILHQEALLLAASGDDDGANDAMLRSLDVAEPAGLAYEAANAHHMLGVYDHNRAGADSPESFQAAADHFEQAGAFYERANMAEQASNTLQLLSSLWARFAQAFPEHDENAIARALQYACTSFVSMTRARVDFLMADRTATEEAKLLLAQKGAAAFERAFGLATGRSGNPEIAWDLADLWKCAVFADMLSSNGSLSERVRSHFSTRPDLLELIEQDISLGPVEGGQSPLADWVRAEQRKAQRADHRRKMAADPALRPYLDLVEPSGGFGLARRIVEDPQRPAGRAIVLAQYVSANRQVWLLLLRSGEDKPEMHQVRDAARVMGFIEDHFSSAQRRRALLDSPRCLETLAGLAPLVAPIAAAAAPDDLIYFIPTRPLHVLPLHLVPVGGGPLIARHPVAYAPSISVLGTCMARRPPDAAIGSAAIFGDPTGDLANSARLVAALGTRFGVRPLTGAAVTAESFRHEVVGKALVHYQGHAQFAANRRQDGDPMASHLTFSGGEKLTAADMASLIDIDASLVVLAGCESGIVQADITDEPFGLLRGVFFAGARSIAASLWRVPDTATALLFEEFYRHWPSGSLTFAKADALRRATLFSRDQLGDEGTPYQWGAFAIHGDWR